MKYTHLLGAFVVLISCNPLSVFAKEIVGITEATFNQLNQSHCAYSDQEGMIEASSGGYCDPLVVQLQDAIVMRVEAHGEQYWINTADGLPIVNRYLPNGFYRSDKKLFWVQDGFRVHIPKKKAFATIMQSAQQQDTRVTPISNADFDRMLQSCEYYGSGNADTDATYQACVAQVALGRATHAKLAHSIVLKVEDAGKLFYIPEGNETNPLGIEKRVLHNEQEMSLYRYLWSEASHAQYDVIQEMPMQ